MLEPQPWPCHAGVQAQRGLGPTQVFRLALHFTDLGLSENRGPQCRRLLIIRTPRVKAPLIFGNSHLERKQRQGAGSRSTPSMRHSGSRRNRKVSRDLWDPAEQPHAKFMGFWRPHSGQSRRGIWS